MLDQVQQGTLSFAQLCYAAGGNRTLVSGSMVTSGSPDIRRQIRMYFSVIPALSHIRGPDSELYVRVNAIQESTGSFVVLEIPATIGPLNNVWDQLVGYQMYDTIFAQPPVELELV